VDYDRFDLLHYIDLGGICLPVSQRPLVWSTDQNGLKYTTQLQAGLGLIQETRVLLGLWQPGMNSPELYQAALQAGAFPAVSARPSEISSPKVSPPVICALRPARRARSKPWRTR